MSFSRREFLKWTTTVGALVGIGESITAPNAAAAPGRPAEPAMTTPYTAFADGEVTAVGTGRVDLATRTGPLRLFVAPLGGTDIWRGGPAQLSDIVPGDFLYARGLPGEEGIATAYIWANIVNLSGRVVRRQRAGLSLADRAGREHEIELPGTARAYLPATRLPLSDLSLIRERMPVRVLGMWQRERQTVAACTVWVS